MWLCVSVNEIYLAWLCVCVHVHALCSATACACVKAPPLAVSLPFSRSMALSFQKRVERRRHVSLQPILSSILHSTASPFTCWLPSNCQLYFLGKLVRHIFCQPLEISKADNAHRMFPGLKGNNQTPVREGRAKSHTWKSPDLPLASQRLHFCPRKNQKSAYHTLWC